MPARWALTFAISTWKSVRKRKSQENDGAIDTFAQNSCQVHGSPTQWRPGRVPPTNYKASAWQKYPIRFCAELCKGLKEELVDKVKGDGVALSRIVAKACNQELGSEENP